jgi:hypothetical protein
VLLLALALAGCSSEPAEEAAQADINVAARPLEAGMATSRPGRVLLRFVEAARRRDPDAMWGLLSRPTRASIGPTLAEFRSSTSEELTDGLGALAAGTRVILSRKLDDEWAVAAVAGMRTVDGKPENFAYAAALRREGGALRLELAGAVVSGHEPGPLKEISGGRPEVAATISAGREVTRVLTWLDGRPLAAARGKDDLPFTATLRGRPRQPLAPGRHEVVVFAATDRTAVASAWSFTVV